MSYDEHLISMAGGDGDSVEIRNAKADALEEAANERDARSATLLQTMQNMSDSREYDHADIVRYGSYSLEANCTATWLRARAAKLRKP